MGNLVIHPRIAKRAIRNRKRRIEANRTVAINNLERAINLLREIRQKPGCDFAEKLIPGYENALLELRSLDPARLPSAESVRVIESRLEGAYNLLNEAFEDCSDKWEIALKEGRWRV